MTSAILALALANLLALALGCGLLPILRLARTRRELLVRLPLAYAVGLAATGILAADLAVVDVPVGRIALPLLAAASLALGLPGLPAGEPWRPRRPRPAELPTLIVLAAAAAFAVPAARLAAVEPLLEPGGWEIWGTRARALFLFGHPGGPVFTDPVYAGLQRPLLLPGLEAVGFRFMGEFDGTLVHLQLIALAVAFAGGAWTLLHRWASPLVLAASLLAIVTAPAFFDRLLSGSADIPLAMFVALGVASLAAWARSGEVGFLTAAALFLGAAALTDNAGEWLAVAALVAAGLATRPAAWRPLAAAGTAVLTIDLPWGIWLWRAHVGRQPGTTPAAGGLWHELWRAPGWGYLLPLALLGLAGALLQRRVRLALFASGWVALSFAGLVALRNSLPSSAGEIAGSLLLGSVLLAPVLLRTGPDRAPVAAPARSLDPLAWAFSLALRCWRSIPHPRLRRPRAARRPRAGCPGSALAGSCCS